MQIIFGNQDIDTLEKRYTLLELDTMRIPAAGDITAYAVIELIDLTAFPHLEQHKNLHKELMENYRKKNWKFCEDAIGHLTTQWRGELDSFYTELSSRIAKYKEQDPGPEWSGIYEKDFSVISD